MSFLIDFWPLNTIPMFGRKNQEGGPIRVGQKTFFIPQIFKK
jgi:hypothetical protein